MGTQAITVRIAGKSYPMTVSSPQEEETIRKAERQIRERLKMYEEKYAVTDIRDLLSMCVLQFATESNENEEKAGSVEQDVLSKLKAIEHALDTNT
ncbi:MAG TPA: cell division protein ZapA [Flavobacteriales bacterium]|nr:cell division protein ZapA [Flavobacteriales bacterium]